MIFRKLIKKNSKSFKNEVGENYSYNMCLAETDFSKGNSSKRVPRTREYLHFQQKVCSKRYNATGRESMIEQNFFSLFPIKEYEKKFFEQYPNYRQFSKENIYNIEVLSSPKEYTELVPNLSQISDIDIISTFVETDLSAFLASHRSSVNMTTNHNLNKKYPMSSWGATEDISRILFNQLMEDEESLASLELDIAEVKSKISELEKFHKLQASNEGEYSHNYSKMKSKMNREDLKEFDEYLKQLSEEKQETLDQLANIQQIGSLQNEVYNLRNKKEQTSSRIKNLVEKQGKRFSSLAKNPNSSTLKSDIEFNQLSLDGSRKEYDIVLNEYREKYKNLISKKEKFPLPIPLNVSVNGNQIIVKKTTENRMIEELKGNKENVKNALNTIELLKRKHALSKNVINRTTSQKGDLTGLNIAYQKYKSKKDEYDRKIAEYKEKQFYFAPYLVLDSNNQNNLKIKEGLEKMQKSKGAWNNKNVSQFTQESKLYTFNQRLDYLLKKRLINKDDLQKMKAVPIKKKENEKFAYKVLRDKKTITQGQYNVIKKEFGLQKKGLFYGGFIETAIIGSYFVASIIAIIMIIFNIFYKVLSIYMSFLMMRCQKNMLVIESQEVFKLFIEEQYENLFFSFLFIISEVIIGSIFFFAPISLVRSVVNLLITLVYKPTQMTVKSKTNVSKSIGSRIASALKVVLNPKPAISYVYKLMTTKSDESLGQSLKKYHMETKTFATCALEHTLGKDVRQKELDRLKKEVNSRRLKREEELSGNRQLITEPLYSLVGKLVIGETPYYQFDVIDINYKNNKKMLVAVIKINAFYADNVYLKYNTDMQKKSSGIFPNYKDLSNKFFKYVGEPTAKVKNTIEEFYQISIEYFKKNYTTNKK